MRRTIFAVSVLIGAAVLAVMLNMPVQAPETETTVTEETQYERTNRRRSDIDTDTDGMAAVEEETRTEVHINPDAQEGVNNAYRTDDNVPAVSSDLHSIDNTDLLRADERPEEQEIGYEEWYQSDISDSDTDDVPGDAGGDSWSDSTAAKLDELPADVDVYELGYQKYGISYLDTERTLKLITYEGYGYSPLSYYVACACWSRATEGYWGYGDLFRAFGEADGSYGTWMDSLGIADYAYEYLRQCYDDPTYVRYVNGMAVPSDYIYYERGIYVWN